MIIIFIGGDDSVRRFAILRHHCSLYERNKNYSWSRKNMKANLLSLPPNSFVALRFRGDMQPEDGQELSCAEMYDMMQKVIGIADVTPYATERDLEIALGFLT